MMPVRPLVRIVRQNLKRNARHFALSAVGIVVGIAAFVFFLGLSGGVRRVVLGDIFPIDRVEVIAPKTTLTGYRAKLDDATVAKIRANPTVANAFPKMKLGFPAKAWGNLLSNPIAFEMGGFADGIDPALIADDPKLAEKFKDWEEVEAGDLASCTEAMTGVCPDEDFYYCGWDLKCHRRVPVLISRTLLEIYNGSFAPSHGLPRIGAAQLAMIETKMKQMRFTMSLGESFLKGTTSNLKSSAEHFQGQLVGISDKAMPIGMTVPIGYVKRWNTRYLGEAAAREYSSIVVEVKDKDDVAEFVSWVKAEGLETEESYAERFALVIQIVTLLFLVISFVIVGLSAVNISHTFFMLMAERRREVGIMRAVGASRADVRLIIMGEAALIGVSTGVLGVLAGVGAARLIDFLSNRYVSDFPFKPRTYFQFTPELLAGALAFAVLFCLLGAFLPAHRTARMQPAQALAS